MNRIKPLILVVDDEIKIQKILIDILKYKGYFVKGVTTGYEALEFCTSFSNISKSTYTWNPDIFNIEGYTDALEAFAAGKVGMMFDYYSSIQEIESKAQIISLALSHDYS